MTDEIHKATATVCGLWLRSVALVNAVQLHSYAQRPSERGYEDRDTDDVLATADRLVSWLVATVKP